MGIDDLLDDLSEACTVVKGLNIDECHPIDSGSYPHICSMLLPRPLAGLRVLIKTSNIPISSPRETFQGSERQWDQVSAGGDFFVQHQAIVSVRMSSNVFAVFLDAERRPWSKRALLAAVSSKQNGVMVRRTHHVDRRLCPMYARKHRVHSKVDASVRVGSVGSTAQGLVGKSVCGMTQILLMTTTRALIVVRRAPAT